MTFPLLEKRSSCLPSINGHSVEQTFLEQSKNKEKMLTDMRMCQSEELYSFHSPCPEHLKVMDFLTISSSFLATILESVP